MISQLNPLSQAEKIKESKQISFVKGFVNNSLSSSPVNIPAGALKELKQQKEFSDTSTHKQYISFENGSVSFDEYLENYINQQVIEKNKQEFEEFNEFTYSDDNLTTRSQLDHNCIITKPKNFSSIRIKLLLELYNLSKVKYAKNKSGDYFEEINTNQIMSSVKCSRTTALKYLKELEEIKIIYANRGHAKRQKSGLIKSPKTTYVINFESLKNHMENKNLIARKSAPVERKLYSNKYKKEIIINKKDVFYLNGKEIEKEVVDSETFIEKNINDIISTAKKAQSEFNLSFTQIKTIIQTFLKVVGNAKRNSQELIRMILGWIKNRYKQIISKPIEIIEKQTSLWQEPDDFIEYNGHKLCNNYVLYVQNEIKNNINYEKIANNSELIDWIPSRDLIFNKSRQIKNIIKLKISRDAFFKLLGSFMITAKLKNIGKEEYLI